MTKTRKIGASLAIVLALVVSVPVMGQDACSNAMTHIGEATTTLNSLKQLFAQIAQRKASEPTAGGTAAVSDNYEPLKCPACGMMMPSKATAKLTKAVKYNGKTYYCCKGCDMSATADKE